ncbi:tetratricopeptide repeat protein [Pseudomonas yamanorum]|uniref:tetratricopeptide repeat protein n=1 Tax=Pseudomonas yamanorum TaxID=515393 RepID=UPI003F755A39
MNKLVIAALMMWSMCAGAESKAYDLSPAFSGALKAEFTEEVSNSGETISGALIDKNGKKVILPDTCEPEGGNAELKDSFVVTAKRNYFLFICAWPVQHSGLGLNGTQYEAFLYGGDNLGALKKNVIFSQALSSYEGSLEEGGHSYAWYLPRKIASEKVIELELGRSTDSLALAHQIVLARLKDEDYEGVKAYLDADRFGQLSREFPIGKSNVVIYNDIGYALGQTGENDLAYKILKSVELVSPDRVVLKLNIADVLWTSDKDASKIYYKKYVESMRQAGKEKLIPKVVLDRISMI